MRQCLFCSLNANSLEDVWPRWITEQFEGSNPITVQAERQGLILKPWASRRPELIVRWVCKSCNNGWMSNLEGQVKPLLQPLLSGTDGSLDSGAQSILAVWAVKTAMALEGLDKPNARDYAQSEREQLRRVNAIPRRTSVWLAVSVDASYLLSTKTRHKRSADTDDITGVSTTMVFGHVALQVFTIRVPSFVTARTEVTANVRAAPWSDLTLRVWPTQPASLVWPPRTGLNGEAGINLFADRFSTSDLEEETLGTLAV
jgi:hypothetical protein